MNERFRSRTWSVEVPPGWRAWQDDVCYTLAPDDEEGALQFSEAFKDTDVLDADLREFAAEHLEAGAEPVSAQAGDFVGFEIAFRNDEQVWRHWYVRHGSHLLFVTWNRTLAASVAHDETARKILTSLRAGHAQRR